MCTVARVGLLILVMASSNGARADWFVQPMYGIGFGGDLDVSEQLMEGDSSTSAGDMDLDSDSLYGVILGLETDDPGNVYLMYSRYDGSLDYTGTTPPINNVNATIDYFHFGGSLYFPAGKWQPYVSASIGAAVFDADIGPSDETRFSMGFALGGRYLFTDHLGLFAETRAMVVAMDSDTNFRCPGNDGSGCTITIKSEALFQGHAVVGLVFRF